MKTTPATPENSPRILEADRSAIDAEFARMATDTEYQIEAQAICEEFALSDWEAFQIGEAEAQLSPQ